MLNEFSFLHQLKKFLCADTCTLMYLFFIFLAVPKANSVFTVDIEGYLCTLYGNQLRIRSAERSSKKFKTKPTTDL